MTRTAPRWTRATADEIAAYGAQTPRPIYPLRGFVTLADGTRLAVEDLSEWPKGDPQYEVMAPKGFYFAPDGTHSLLCFTVQDVRDRVDGIDLRPCGAGCGCA